RTLSLRLLSLGAATGCVALAGHPQLPTYAIAAAALHAVCRRRDRRALRVLAGVALGARAAAFALWPEWLPGCRRPAVLAARRRPRPPWAFVVALGVLGLVLALPVAHPEFLHLPGTFLRSPARLIYLTTFALALALGAGLDVLLGLPVWRGRRTWGLGLALA